MTKEEERKAVHSAIESGEIEKETVSSVMSMLAKRRWAGISPKKRSAHMKKVSHARFK